MITSKNQIRMKIIIKTFHGLEEILQEEVKKIGGKNIEVIKRGVSCEGDMAFVYRANLELRTALRVLVLVHEFLAHTERDLYKKVSKFDWTTILSEKQTFAIDSVVYSTLFNHSKFIALRVKDAIVDQFRDKVGSRPDIDIKFPDVRLHVHISEKLVTISLDSSGISLHKRGYRNSDHEAPLNEALAAGIILMSQWDKKSWLYDPMCGSGTILMEAAMIAANIPPRINLSYFGFMKWKTYDEALWNQIKDEAKSKIQKCERIIFGSDIKSKYVRLAQESIKHMKLDHIITVTESHFADREIKEGSGIIVSNPPYGERLKEDDIKQFYSEIGDFLKAKCAGKQAWIISSNMEALKHVGLKPSKKITLFNGPLECKMYRFDIFQGSRKELLKAQ